MAAVVVGTSTLCCFLLYKKTPPKEKIRKISEIAICKIKDNSVKYNKNIEVGIRAKKMNERISNDLLLFSGLMLFSSPLPSVYKVSKKSQ
ncbi:hypothetical protein [Bacillus sp. B1-b2]|uniref:hypothetical protein n=1 Tax=Bacillus sp. B1-b2 TaxID=2653201 RepID=UPI0012623104|nr:hypothetical protein [Bacillus sp. B1-b2]KAB7670060.1 hypothetical protein F9279_10015 [Bacillus sp. B1-b2]